MTEIIVNTQAELDAIPKDFAGRIVVKGGSLSDPIKVHAYDSATVRACGSATVWAYDSATVWACGSATVWACGSATVWAYDSATVRACGSATVEAYDSATVWACDSATVWACGSATVWACGSATVRAYDSATVWATKWAVVRKMLRHTGAIEGGIVIAEPGITTPEDWCAYHGVTVTDGVAIVYKAVRDDYRSLHGFLYPVGASVECWDWDGGMAECGGGLHFSPSPSQAHFFDENATRFLACPVALADMRAPKLTDDYPQKIKARRVCGPIVEVDMRGEAI